MNFYKDKDVYKVARITGAQDNILGITFSQDDEPIQVLEWELGPGRARRTSRGEVLDQVVAGVKEANEELGAQYKVSKIFFIPSELAFNSVYLKLAKYIVHRLDSNGEFVENK